MKLSWKATTLAALISAAEGNAFISTNFHTRPTSSLGMVRGRRSMLPSSRSLLAPSQIFREMDQMLEDSFSTFDDFFGGPLMLSPSSPFAQRANRVSDFAVVRRPRPTYKLTEDEEKVQLVVNIPGAKAEDIKAEIEQNGRVIRLSGISKVDEDGVSIESQFEKAFMLGRHGVSFDEENVTARMADGVLTITAPKITEEVKEPRRISITEEKAASTPVLEEKSGEGEVLNDVKEEELKEDAVDEKKLSGEDAEEVDLDEDSVIEL
eukprot:CAMPEP_0197432736 /NCGR_PEP_ID=MMETSP1175-20131217/763_1 /TAXON_ID=1003142 /ORGANISM="Triceratium dubium, Strain CCMP147" /LENGTH=264 /DNA_ID=CAMNT_0042960901 /DNA_START=43 /DNA_END=837 /DNA_ORIENTATION=-